MLMVTWGLPKGGISRKRLGFLNTQSWNKDRCRYFVAKNTNFFLIYHIFNFDVWFHFHWIWNFCYILIEISINKRNIDFNNDFPIHIVVWILCNIKNIRKWNVIMFLDFTPFILEYRFQLYEITMNLMF
jgi:hypothetical protein